jgi:hypothetical protein
MSRQADSLYMDARYQAKRQGLERVVSENESLTPEEMD